LGCDTLSVEATLMVMLPWETAQLEMWMLAVATMVPVRSLMMMRAGMLGVTSMFSSRAMNPTGSLSRRRAYAPARKSNPPRARSW
jgi:hypothetical protein